MYLLGWDSILPYYLFETVKNDNKEDKLYYPSYYFFKEAMPF